MQVHIGRYYLSSGGGHDVRKTKQTVIHAGYSPSTSANDIALLLLDGPSTKASLSLAPGAAGLCRRLPGAGPAQFPVWQLSSLRGYLMCAHAPPAAGSLSLSSGQITRAVGWGAMRVRRALLRRCAPLGRLQGCLSLWASQLWLSLPHLSEGFC